MLVATCVCQTCRSDMPADTLEVWRWTEGGKSVASLNVKETWQSSQPLEPICQGPAAVQSREELHTKRLPSAACLPQRLNALRHWVQKEHVPLCKHTQPVTRSWLKIPGPIAVVSADRRSWIPHLRCKLKAHSYQAIGFVVPISWKALHEFHPWSYEG